MRIKRWKVEQKCPSDTLSFDDSDKRWLAYLRAHVGNLELLPAIVTHWERTAKPITRPLKVEELCSCSPRFFRLSAQTSAKCLAGVLLTQFAT